MIIFTTVNLIIGSTFSVTLLSLFAVLIWLAAISGKRYNPDLPKDMAKLIKIAQLTFPIITSLDKFSKDKGCYPLCLDELIPDYLDSSFQIKLEKINHININRSYSYHGFYTDNYRCDYSVYLNCHKFTLYIKLGWDPRLYYSSEEKHWYYNPGDGSQETRLDI
jgi:hypothetical protein